MNNITQTRHEVKVNNNRHVVMGNHVDTVGTKKLPQTGATNDLSVALAGLAISSVGLAGAMASRRKKNN